MNIKLCSGLVIHCHFNQIRISEYPVVEKDADVFADFLLSTDATNVSDSDSSSDSPVTESLPSNHCYPLRARKAPDRLNL